MVKSFIFSEHVPMVKSMMRKKKKPKKKPGKKKSR